MPHGTLVRARTFMMMQVLAMADLPGAATSFVALVRASEPSAGAADGVMVSQFRQVGLHAHPRYALPSDHRNFVAL